MVTRDYQLAKPPPPPAWKRFFDQRIIPLAIDLAGAAESAALGGAGRVQRRPWLAAALLVGGLGLPVVLMIGRRR